MSAVSGDIFALEDRLVAHGNEWNSVIIKRCAGGSWMLYDKEQGGKAFGRVRARRDGRGQGHRVRVEPILPCPARTRRLRSISSPSPCTCRHQSAPTIK
eukprot:scaffold4486_cov125-Isochrysis_galbana.AAC.1